MKDQDKLIRIMFVCMGNICRSPLAEGVFRHQAREAGVLDHFEIASSGTGAWHIGQKPDRRMNQVAEARGVSMKGQRAQQFEFNDFDYYDYIFVMDRDNLHHVMHFDAARQFKEKVRLFREHDPYPGDMEVPDPYYGGAQGFERVFEMVDRTCNQLLAHLVKEELS